MTHDELMVSSEQPIVQRTEIRSCPGCGASVTYYIWEQGKCWSAMNGHLCRGFVPAPRSREDNA
jgi:hypothetical protein